MILVVLPTFRRLQQFRWSLRSVLLAGRAVPVEKRLRIIGNDPPSVPAVERIVAEETRGDRQKGWDIAVVRREQSLPPVENWYQAIQEQAHDGDVVFLHGDDDVMLPNSIGLRADALAGNEGVLLLSRFVSGLLYDGDQFCLPVTVTPPPTGVRPVVLDYGDELMTGAPFIGNHCYRYGNAFRESLRLALQWCDGQDWLVPAARRLMLPYYLPLAARHLGQTVLGLDVACEARGHELAELQDEPYGVRGWNNPLLYGGTLEILSRPPLASVPALAAERRVYRRSAAQGIPQVLLDRGLSLTQRRRWLQRVVPLVGTDVFLAFKGLALWVNEVSGRRRWRVRQKHGHRPRQRTEEWLASLYA